MKKNDWILTIAVVAYSYLFYRQAAGVNYLVFSILLLLLLVIRNPTVMRPLKWKLAAAGVLLSAYCVFQSGDALSITANWMSLLLLSAFSFDARSSLFTSLFFSFYSIASSNVFLILDAIERRQKRVKSSEKNGGANRFLLILAPVLIALLFFFLYKGANPLFDNFTKKINLDFISISWIFFTLGGFLLLYGFFYHRQIDLLARTDQSASNKLFPSGERNGRFDFLSLANERFSAILLFVLLNLLLLFVNGIDINYLFLDAQLPADMSYSGFVHQGTGMLITSIVIAIFIILFYFRGGLNFAEKTTGLRWLAILWVVQNMFMVVSTAFRNNLYIHEYSLTYKRIGVYIYLLLAMIGLVTTCVKIVGKKSNWFLFRSNGWLFYLVLLLSCLVSWDRYVSDFNINQALAKNKALDKSYLVSLSYSNLPQLLKVSDTIPDKPENDDWDNLYRGSRVDYYLDFQTQLNLKLYYFMDNWQQHTWQSLCLDKQKTYAELLGQKETFCSFSTPNCGLSSLAPLFPLDHITSIRIPGNHLLNLYELSSFPRLEQLDLSNNQVDSLDHFPLLPELESLQLNGNNLRNVSKLSAMQQLTDLDLSGNASLDMNSFPRLARLQQLSLDGMYINNFTKIAQQPNLKKLTLVGSIVNNLKAFPVFSSLQELVVSGNYICLNDSVFFQQLSKSDQLVSLDLSDNRITDLTVLTHAYTEKFLTSREQRNSALFPNLKRLNVSNNQLNVLYNLYLYKNLEELNLSGNQLSSLSGLELLQQLRVLNLDRCSLTDIRSLQKLHALTDLSLTGNSIRDYSVLLSMKQLTHLSIDDPGKEILAKLKTALPMTKIECPTLLNND